MRTHTVYFEIFGKKMKADVSATSDINAAIKVKDSLQVHKVVKVPITPDMTDEEFVDAFKSIFGIDPFKQT